MTDNFLKQRNDNSSADDDNGMTLCVHCGHFIEIPEKHMHGEMDENDPFQTSELEYIECSDQTFTEFTSGDLCMFCGILTINLVDHVQQQHDIHMSIGKTNQFFTYKLANINKNLPGL